MKTLLRSILLVMISISLILATVSVAVASEEKEFFDRRAVVVREFDDDLRPIVIVKDRPVFSPFFFPFLFDDDFLFEEEEFFELEDIFEEEEDDD